MTKGKRKPTPSPLLHLGTSIRIVIGRPNAAGTGITQATIDGTIAEFTEAAWVAAFREAKAKFDEAAKT